MAASLPIPRASALGLGAALAWSTIPSLSTAATPTAGAQLAPEVTRTRLENGLEVVLMEDRRAPVVAMTLRYPVGATRDPPHAGGMAHVVEHMMFASAAGPGPGAYDRWTFEAGGANNAWTDPDWTVYTAVVPADRVPGLLRQEAARMTRLPGAGSNAALNHVLAVVRAERQAATGSTTASLVDVLRTAGFGADHPLGRPTLGTAESLQQIGPDAVQAFHQDHYGPNGATLVLVGDLDPAATLQAIGETLGAVPARARPTPKPPGHWAPPDPVRRWTAPAGRATAYVAWALPDTLDDGADVAAALLSTETPAGRGLGSGTEANPLRAWSVPAHHGRLFVLAIDIEGRNANRTLRRLGAQLQARAAHPPTAEILRAVAGRHAGRLARHVDDISGRSATLSACLAAGQPASCARDEARRWATATPAAVLEVFAHLHASTEHVIVLAIPAGSRVRGLPAATPVEFP